MYWDINEKAVRDGYENVINNFKMTKTDKSFFFTCEVLVFLTQSGKKLRVPKMNELIEYYLEYVDKHDYYRWNQRHIFLEIVKQRILLDYLQNTLNLYSDVDIEIKIVEALSQVCHLLYETNEYL